ncbi:MAG: ECF-type sigma factor, partial [Mycobacterium sp.]
DVDETAAVLKVSRRTVLRDWALARSWLSRELRRPTDVDPKASHD